MPALGYALEPGPPSRLSLRRRALEWRASRMRARSARGAEQAGDPGCPGRRPLPIGTALRHHRPVENAHFEMTAFESEAYRDSGRTTWAAASAKPLAIGIAALSVALCAGAVALLWLAPAHHPYSYDVSADLVVGSLFPLAGALIAIRDPGNRCGWVL